MDFEEMVKEANENARSLGQALIELSLKIEKMVTKMQEDFIIMMDLTFKNKTLTVLTNEDYRGFSKTSYLINKAKELNCVLVVPKHLVNYVRDLDSDVEILGVNDSNIETFRGKRFTNGFIVDEGVSLNSIRKLKYCGEFLGGIASLNSSL